MQVQQLMIKNQLGASTNSKINLNQEQISDQAVQTQRLENSYQKRNENPLNIQSSPTKQIIQSQMVLSQPSNEAATQSTTKIYVQNEKTKTNTFIFGLLLILTQIALTLVYIFKINAPSLDYAVIQFLQTIPNISFTPIILNIFMAFIAVVGFGLLFAYNRRLIWTALGFNFLIVCLSIEFYFVANNLINRIGIVSTTQQYSEYWQIYLWNFQSHSTKPTTELLLLTDSDAIHPFGNTLIGAFKCGIANCIAFSSLIGKSGLLQAYIVTFFGTIIYQFSRQINQKLGIDFAQSNSVFIFGGFYGLAIGLIQLITYRKPDNQTRQHKLYTGSMNSVNFSLIGCVILISLLPAFALHPTISQRSNFRQFLNCIPSSYYYSISASSIISISCSYFINKKLQIRDLINGILAGAVAIFSASFFITVPIHAQIVGAFAGIIQCSIQNFIQKRNVRKNHSIISTYSFYLFGVQGLVGVIFASIFRAILKKDDYYTYFYFSQYLVTSTQPILLGLISAALGLGIGFLVGFLLHFISFQTKKEHFNDATYWQDQGHDSPFTDDQQLIRIILKRKDKFSPGLLPFL